MDTNGEVKPCCAARVPFGNIKDNSIKEIINGKLHLEVKQALLDGVKHSHCSYCYEAEAASGDSTRHWFNQYTPVDNPALADYTLQMIDIRWSNHCNLRCLYCNPRSSSRIAELFNIQEKLSVRQWQDEIMQMVRENILTIKHVYLLGGEPMLIKENLELLEMINDQEITLITNLALDNSANKIYAQLINKPNVIWSISLEHIGNKFEYIRNGANWNRVLENVNDLKHLRKNYYFTMQYCLYSALDLHEILTTLTNIANVSLNMLVAPGQLVVEYHCNKIRDIAITEINKVLSDTALCSKLHSDNIVMLQNIRQTIISSPPRSSSAAFIDYEQSHNPGPHRFEDLWPEVWKILQEDANEKVVT